MDGYTYKGDDKCIYSIWYSTLLTEGASWLEENVGSLSLGLEDWIHMDGAFDQG